MPKISVSDPAVQNPRNQGSTGGGAATSAGIRFEQQLGAIMGVNILAGRPLDRRFKLGSANPLWVRFETEAPVDDLLVATSDGGFVAIQAKTTVSLSRDLRSGFGKTVAQFVRHWIACRDGDGRQGWNRPLNSERDRLALIVGPQTSSTIKNDLPGALRHRAELGTTSLNEAQQRAVEAFDACVQEAWISVTSEPFNPKLLSELAKSNTKVERR